MSTLVHNRNNGSADEYGHLLSLNRVISGDVIEGLAVVAKTSPNMSVTVSAGSARISTGTYPSSYGYFVSIDTTSGSPAGESVTITTAPTSNSRIDTIVAYVDLSVTASSGTANNPNNMLKLAAVAGTVAGSPTAPSNGAIQSAIGASNPFIKLANVAVGTSVTQINSGNITDTRTFAQIPNQNVATSTLGYSQITSNFTTTTAGSLVDVTGLSATVTVPTGGRRIKITAYVSNLTSTQTGVNGLQAAILESSTQLANSPITQNVANWNTAVTAMASFVATAGSHTYKVQALQQSAGTLTAAGSSTNPSFILIEVI